MAVPQAKISKARKKKRRSHHALKEPGLSLCPRCSQVILPHSVCDGCGHYRGRKILKVEETKKS
jgi:large subunit ribosomal protein L32